MSGTPPRSTLLSRLLLHWTVIISWDSSNWSSLLLTWMRACYTVTLTRWVKHHQQHRNKSRNLKCELLLCSCTLPDGQPSVSSRSLSQLSNGWWAVMGLHQERACSGKSSAAHRNLWDGRLSSTQLPFMKTNPKPQILYSTKCLTSKFLVLIKILRGQPE